MKKYIQEYCVGCGLCKAIYKTDLVENTKGYLYPKGKNSYDLEKICPASGRQINDMDFSKIWGRAEDVYYGWSTNDSIRKKASSAGVLTEVAIYLLEKKKVDAILHVCMSKDNPTETEVCISTSRDEIIARSGSRYSISHPLENIDMLDKTLKYAFIGKPCDVTTLKNYMKINPEMEKLIPYTLSFFCAGLPSKEAQKKLLEKMGCNAKVKTLRYRGDGWPGFTTAVDVNGNISRLKYSVSWGEILGRDIMKMCRFCLDGIGELADISCCDAWYLNDEKNPDFSEGNGRNAIFCRSKKGKMLIQEMKRNGNIYIEKFDEYEETLKYMQRYQADRRATMNAKLLATKIMLKPTPKYPISKVILYAPNTKLRTRWRIFKGTIKRILQKKI